MMHEPPPLRLGTRASPLARWQAAWVAEQLRAAGVAIELVPITTRGDQQQVGPIAAMGQEGVFTKELQRALLAREIDLAVHSLKDLPTEAVPGLVLAATPPRGPVGDVLLARESQTLAEMPEGSRIGTGSPRRRAQLWHARPDLKMLDVRGNVDTRLAKLHGGEYDALVLAEAGVTRLELATAITERLSPERILPAVGQGALGIEARSDDDACRAQLEVLNDPATWSAVTAERTLLAALRGGCLAPLGAWGRIVDQELRLTAVVLSPDGRQRLFAEAAERPEAAVELGQRVATALREQGSDALLQAARAR